MTFAVGIFDLFSFAVPGAVQLALLAYVLDRLGVLHVAALVSAPGALLVAGAVVTSYLLGHLFHPLAAQLERLRPRPDAEEARKEFLARVPRARDRAYVQTDPALLVAAIELHDKDAGGEIIRMRAQSVMLRNIAFAFAVATVVALVQTATGPHQVVAAVAAVLSVLGTTAALGSSRKVWHMSRLKTLDVCYWIPDIDETFTADAPAEG
ncbi:hypothetical protein CU254_10955 [Amycolatopsis sp. AA4]|uniref:hypothetical protein n=1 Tax=Actinomycetes TaxID=1760 RepID=UPI0001B5859D|nr:MULTISPECIES: hypothetical protein [Actinomycetes]ATY10935.1 hypothetical protein CU254_10955 [Amycolatopsis sp. AA4]